ncbi:MAG: hypothetical protein JO138_12230 [Acidobacteriaceae bacterium]|nr:hypothetical protein [Acidobacteriaceae bacterium]
MFSIVGILVVVGAIVGGYLMEKGNLQVLLQPSEALIIIGAAAGTLLIANPLPVVTGIFKRVLGAFGSSRYSKKHYLITLKRLRNRKRV